MEQSKELSAIEKLMKSADAEALAELAEMTGVNKTSFIQGDPVSTSYNEGIRSVGLRLIQMTEKEPLDLIKEASRRRFGNYRRK